MKIKPFFNMLLISVSINNILSYNFKDPYNSLITYSAIQLNSTFLDYSIYPVYQRAKIESSWARNNWMTRREMIVGEPRGELEKEMSCT